MPSQWLGNHATEHPVQELGGEVYMYLSRKCSCWNLARLCVGGVMCMDRGVTRMLSKTTLRPHHIAGVGRDRFVVSKHVFGFFELTMFTCVGGSM